VLVTDLVLGVCAGKRTEETDLNSKEWRHFEQAVASFAKALDPTAEVLFDHWVPDRETGKLRQCDAWINARYGGHWPFSVYVSCKDRRKSKRKLHQGDIDVFSAEILARGASMGVLYTNTDFTRPAIEKAQKKGIPCCRLYRNEPADIPEAVWIKQFICKPSIIVNVSEKPRHWPLNTWGEVFSISASGSSPGKTVLDVITKDFLANEQSAFDAVKVKGAPPNDWQSEFILSEEGWEGKLVFTVRGHWKVYAARLDGVLLDGSYSFNNKSFRGGVKGPLIDTQSAHPGPEWEETDPREITAQPNRVVVVMYCNDVESRLRASLAKEHVPNPRV